MPDSTLTTLRILVRSNRLIAKDLQIILLKEHAKNPLKSVTWILLKDVFMTEMEKIRNEYLTEEEMEEKLKTQAETIVHKQRL